MQLTYSILIVPRLWQFLTSCRQLCSLYVNHELYLCFMSLQFNLLHLFLWFLFNTTGYEKSKKSYSHSKKTSNLAVVFTLHCHIAVRRVSRLCRAIIHPTSLSDSRSVSRLCRAIIHPHLAVRLEECRPSVSGDNTPPPRCQTRGVSFVCVGRQYTPDSGCIHNIQLNQAKSLV